MKLPEAFGFNGVLGFKWSEKSATWNISQKTFAFILVLQKYIISLPP
jgi:hypothetical protein